jgi:hypothetical protein
MATKKISPQTQTTVLELTGKFGPQGFISKLFGSSKEKKDMQFTGKAKVVKGKDTASKIKPLQQGNNLLDMLLKIYTFLQKNFDADKLAREKENNFKEEELLEAQKRHEKLLAALEDLKKNLMPKEVTAVPEKKDEGPSLFDSLFKKLYEKLFGELEKKLLDKLKNLLPKEAEKSVEKAGSSRTAQLLAYLVGETIAVPAFLFSLPWFMAAKSKADIDKDPFNPKFDGIPYAQVARGKAKTQGEAAAQFQREVTNKSIGGGGYGLTPSEAKNILENGTPKDIEAFGGKEKLQEIASQPEAPKVMPKGRGGLTQPPKVEPTSPTSNRFSAMGPSKPKSAPVQGTPASDKLNNVVAQNNEAKINAMPAPPSVSTINNTIQSGGNKKTKAFEKLDVPHVRNQEETFRKMILYSTRVV